MLPLVLLFGPLDPTGADGLPGDALTCASLGCHALSAPTALCVRDTASLEDVQLVSPDFLDDQARCLLEDMPVQAIKVGTIFSAEVASAIAQITADYNEVAMVLHLHAPGRVTDGEEDEPEDCVAAALELLLPQAALAVVDHTELTQWQADGLIEAGEQTSLPHALANTGAQWVLAMGVALRPGHYANLLIGADGQTTHLHWVAPLERGSSVGGLVSTAVAAYLAAGQEMTTAVEQALKYAYSAQADSFQPGMGGRLARRLVTERPS